MKLKSPDKESEYKASVDDKGNVILKKKSKIKSGKKSKASGGQFELRVRKDLENKGWIVDKWANNLDLDTSKVHPAKRKFNPFSKVMTIGTGFPDFIAFQLLEKGRYKIIGVEVKVNGNLSLEEKKKCKVYLDKKIFSEILIAKKKKEKNRVFVEYIEFDKIFKGMRR
tara:strand:+ start:2926 stop:3429 length:504 start_codon:yes stop_codon:yes gene_type:complete